MKIKKINVHLIEEQIEQRVRELGAEISKVYGDEPVCLICILKGSVFFTCELAKRITSPVEIEFMSVSSYGSGTSSSGVVRIVNDLGTSIEGKNVLVIEDIIDSGRTLSYLLENLKTRNPKTLRLCTLLDKPDCLACVCKSTEKDAHSNVKNKRVCKEGPVFRAEEVDF